MPSVAINKVVPSWLTRCRSTRRSISHATENMMTAAIANAIRLAAILLSIPSHCGIHSAKRAMASAANNTIAPCAKLNTPEALKIRTKPKATNEYSMPAIRPPKSVSKKKAISCSNFQRPPQNRLRRAAGGVPCKGRGGYAERGRNRGVPYSVTRSEVSLDHVRVVADFVGCAIADFFAVVQHHHAVGDVHHHTHVVFD